MAQEFVATDLAEPDDEAKAKTRPDRGALCRPRRPCPRKASWTRQRKPTARWKRDARHFPSRSRTIPARTATSSARRAISAVCPGSDRLGLAGVAG